MSGLQIYVVKSGDNLWRLSRRKGVSVGKIVRANGLENPGKLVTGQALLIPESYPRYTVKPGESVASISRHFGTTAKALLQVNRISNASRIYPGQKLTIPTQFPPTHPDDPEVYLRVPPASRRSIEVNAFVTQFGTPGGNTVRQYGADLTYISPFAYRITAQGGLTPIDDTAILSAARQENIVPMLAITNFSSTEPGTALAHTILSNLQLQDQLLQQVLETMRNKGYQGVNVDFENVSPEDKDPYNQFLQRAVDKLRSEGYFVSTSLAPKTSGQQKGLLYEAHDYPAQGRIVDFVVLMTYEWGYRLGPPQAISPINQIRRVLDYAVTVIPRDKIMMGFQVYARDWLLPHTPGMQAETFDTQEAIRRAVQYNASIQYDETAQSPYFRYTDGSGRRHEVWFEDARSAQAKFQLVPEYNLRGISYWVLEYPFPQNWTLLEDTFNVRKL